MAHKMLDDLGPVREQSAREKALSNMLQKAASSSKSTTTASKTSSPSYEAHIKYFGSPEAYAAAIKAKEASGGTLSDKAAAEAFKKAYPELFRDTTTTSAPKAVPAVTSTAKPAETASSVPSTSEVEKPESTSKVSSYVRSGGSSSSGRSHSSGSSSSRGGYKLVTPPGMATPTTPSASPVTETPTTPSTSPVTEAPTAPEPEKVGDIRIDVPAGQRLAEGTPAGTMQQTLSRGAAGFVERTAPLAQTLDVDRLYEIYKEVTGGREDPAVREYLASPQFRAVLGGAIPMWMRTDPIWGAYLRRLGLISAGSTSPRKQALGRRIIRLADGSTSDVLRYSKGGLVQVDPREMKGFPS